jgi:phenylpyruvate tautomerase PptA (4-oxalocrotonate tautomerase family)
MDLPLVEIFLTEGVLTRNQKVKVANNISNLLMEEIPNLPKESISIIFHDIPVEDWIVGGTSVKELVEKTRK